MSDEIEQLTFDLTCSNGTVFTLPSDHPDITAGDIGGVSYTAILEDPSLMPEQFEQFCTFRPEPPPEMEPEPPIIEGEHIDATIGRCDRCDEIGVLIVGRRYDLCLQCVMHEFADSLANTCKFGKP